MFIFFPTMRDSVRAVGFTTKTTVLLTLFTLDVFMQLRK